MRIEGYDDLASEIGYIAFHLDGDATSCTYGQRKEGIDEQGDALLAYDIGTKTEDVPAHKLRHLFCLCSVQTPFVGAMGKFHMTVDSVSDADHNSGYDNEDCIPDKVVKTIGKRWKNQYSYQFEQHFGNADPCPGIHMLVGNDERGVGDADELEEHCNQRAVENYLCSTDAFDRNDHLLVDVP